MQAWVNEKGGKRPTLRDWPVAEPGLGEVRITLEATALHPVDIESSEGGNAMMLPMSRPFVGGVDVVGVVCALGDGVDDLDLGTRVFGYRGVPVQGGWAEELVVPRDQIARAPDLDVHTLATLPLPILCAMQAMDAAGVGPGDTVLVHGGAGGVGSVAVQVFAAHGLHVLATASARDTDWVRSLGAAQVIDYRTTRFEEVVSEAHLVFDTVGGDTLKRSFAVTRAGGSVISLSALPPVDALVQAGMTVPLPLRALLPMVTWWNARAARAAGVRFAGQVTVPSGRRLADAVRAVDGAGFQTRIDRHFPWAELSAAVDHAASGTARGRVVITRA